jgi:TonB family protein
MLPEGVPAPLVAPLEQAAAKWSFEPPIRHGVPVSARTYARVKLVLVPKDSDHYGVQVDFLSNGPSLQFTRNPVYPMEMIRDRAEGTVRMSLIVQPDGRVTDIQLKDANMIETHVVRAQRATSVFASAAHDAIQSMQAKPELVNGKPVATTVVLPVGFHFSRYIPGEEVMSGSVVGRSR